MKNRLLYLLPVVLALASGCLGSKNSDVMPANPPLGTFSGEFKLTHINSKTRAIDSTKANIVLQMQTATGYKVTGDTATLHAGSHGDFAISTAVGQIQFIDVTYPTTGTPTKVHLSGVYQYLYQGTNLQMVAYGPQDTLSFYYNLTRTGN